MHEQELVRLAELPEQRVDSADELPCCDAGAGEPGSTDSGGERLDPAGCRSDELEDAGVVRVCELSFEGPLSTSGGTGNQGDVDPVAIEQRQAGIEIVVAEVADLRASSPEAEACACRGTAARAARRAQP